MIPQQELEADNTNSWQQEADKKIPCQQQMNEQASKLAEVYRLNLTLVEATKMS